MRVEIGRSWGQISTGRWKAAYKKGAAMAKEEKTEKKPEGEKGKSGGGKKKLHLHEMRLTAAHDGTIVHHETYKSHKNDCTLCPSVVRLQPAQRLKRLDSMSPTCSDINQAAEQEPDGDEGQQQPAAGAAMPGA